MTTAVFLFTFPCKINSSVVPTLELYCDKSSTAYGVAANDAQRVLSKANFEREMTLAEQVKFLIDFTGIMPTMPFRDAFSEITADIFKAKYPKYVYAYFNEDKKCLETSTGEYLGDVIIIKKRNSRVPIKITNSINGFEYQGYWHKSHGNHCRVELMLDILKYELENN